MRRNYFKMIDMKNTMNRFKQLKLGTRDDGLEMETRPSRIVAKVENDGTGDSDKDENDDFLFQKEYMELDEIERPPTEFENIALTIQFTVSLFRVSLLLFLDVHLPSERNYFLHEQTHQKALGST